MTPELFWIDAGTAGRLAISLRPRGGDWLSKEIDGWKASGIGAVVSLLTPDEELELGLSNEAAECAQNRIEFHSLPIPDLSAPVSTTEAVELLNRVEVRLVSGQNVAVHCRQGVGRSSTICAGLLVLRGTEPASAFKLIKAARGIPVPETEDQRAWVEQLSRLAPSARD